MEKFRKIADQLAIWRPELRLFNFGEPLLHPQLGEMILYAQAKHIDTRVQTNGLLLDEKHCRTLLESGLAYIGISVNGLTETEYSAIRPDCNLADLKANVRLLRQIQAQLGKPAHIHINAQILAEERNNRQTDINRFVAYWEGLPDSLSVSGISLFENIAVMEAGCKQTVRQSVLARKPGAAVVCKEPFDRLVVKWDGRVTPCCVDYDAQMVLGHVDEQALAEIWHGPKIAALRQIVLEKCYESSILCRNCPKLYSREFTLLFQKKPR